ncbi:MAG: outer membrane lipoprotein carrier protein LolA [Bacteroidetes bacterium]|jgi:outer membrane lipoprotein carrier protein|nr:outer membrane lipoprotein carrier protein LolA [Bacteroidota bacterium]
MNVLKTSFLVSFLLLFFSLHAQQSADDLLKQVIDKTKSYSSIKVEFDYRMLNEDAGIDEVKSGVVIISGDAYKLMMAEQTVISDGVTIWTYLEDSEEVMISNAADGEENITPSRILTSYYEDHKISYQNNHRNEEEGYTTIELKPESGKKFAKIQIAIDEANLQIKSFSIFDNGGNEFIYLIKTMVDTNSLDDSFFRFDTTAFPDVEVIDMR